MGTLQGRDLVAMLPKGGNAPLVTTSVRAVLAWARDDTSHDIDLCALVVAADGHVRTDRDFVFYNQPSHPTSRVIHEGRAGSTEQMLVEVTSLPDDIERVVLAASISEGTFGAVRGLSLTIADAGSGEEEHRFEVAGAAGETALVVGEIYRRGGSWKFRAVGQGWDDGLASLATHYGVRIGGAVEDTPSAAAQVPEPTPAQIPEPLVRTPEPTTQPVESAPVVADAPPPPRRRITGATVPRGAETLGSAPVTLQQGGTVAFTRTGAPPLRHAWLRVTRTNDAATTLVDVAALTYDRFGTIRELVDHSRPGTADGSVGLVHRPVSSDPAQTGAVELNLDSVDSDTAGIVLAALGGRGDTLSSSGSIVTEVVDETGAVVVRTECPAPGASAVLLVTLTRADDGSWFLAALGLGAGGRSVRSLVGAGHWALGA